jgi:biopolymer transport protein ExbD
MVGTAVLCVGSAVGCSSITPRLQRREGIRIQVRKDGRVAVEGRHVELSGLARRLRAVGARPTTHITVEVPEDVSQRLMTDLTVKLSQAGFRMFVFARPMKPAVLLKGRGP